MPFADVRQGLIPDGTDDDDAVVFTGAPPTGHFGGSSGISSKVTAAAGATAAYKVIKNLAPHR